MSKKKIAKLEKIVGLLQDLIEELHKDKATRGKKAKKRAENAKVKHKAEADTSKDESKKLKKSRGKATKGKATQDKATKAKTTKDKVAKSTSGQNVTEVEKANAPS